MTFGSAFSFLKPRPSATNQPTDCSGLTCLSVFRLRFAFHLVVDGHHCDRVLCVRLQVLQDGGGGGPAHLVLVGRKRNNCELGELWDLENG